MNRFFNFLPKLLTHFTLFLFTLIYYVTSFVLVDYLDTSRQVESSFASIVGFIATIANTWLALKLKVHNWTLKDFLKVGWFILLHLLFFFWWIALILIY